MEIKIPENNKNFSQCYPHPFVVKESGKIYCRAMMGEYSHDDLVCQDCPLMMYDAEHDRYFGCYYFDTSPSESVSDCERISLAVSEGELPEFPYFEEKDRHLVESALQFAAVAHKGQLRKGGRIPYFAHVLEASGIVHKISDEAELIAAAALHDVVEDAGVTVDELRERFGDHVADLVASVSENKRSHLPAAETWEIRKKEALEALREAGLETKTLVLGDKLSNMRSCKRDHDVEGDAMWEKFNCKDKRMQKRYYHDVLDALGELSDTYAYKELKTLIDDVFE